MGLLEQKLKGLLSYIDANTPRATRPVAKPSQVIKQGLINPNKYNEPAASRFKDSAFGLLGVVPGVGDAASAVESADLFNRGEKFAGSMAALGTLPIVPAIGGMFIGKGAKTWDVLKAQQAEEMLAKGIDPREVWKQTGTLMGVDGALRQEIPDNEALFLRRNKSGGKTKITDLKTVVKHDDLYAAYPDLGNVRTGWQLGNPEYLDGGNYYPDKRESITLFEGSNFVGPAVYGSPEAISATAKTKDDLVSNYLHEITHAIQQREGFATGGAPFLDAADQEIYNAINKERAALYRSGDIRGLILARDGFHGKPLTQDDARMLDLQATQKKLDERRFNNYRRLAGEAEARLTQSRMGLDAAQRLQHYPYDMGQYGLDVPMDQMIVRGLLGE